MLSKKDPSTFAAIFVLSVTLLYPVFFGFPYGIISYDTFGYYLYLPQTFITGDIALTDVSTIESLNQTYHFSGFLYQFHPLENGHHVIQYSSGVALLSLPFFLVGHGFAWLLGFPMDGYSEPYMWSMIAGSYFYMVLGVILFRKAMLCFFSKKITALLLVTICLGTNYLSIHFVSHGMPHVYSFPLFAAVILFSYKWHQNHKLKYIIGIAIVVALMILIRPLDGLVILFPLLFGVTNFSTLKKQLTTFFRHYKDILLSLFIGLVICSIQMCYWKFVTGHFIFNSYQNPEEGMYLDDPHLTEFLFSFRKGWFIYTPIMLVAFIGFFVKSSDYPKWILPLSIFIVLTVYMSASWSTWWYAASFSQRTMSQSYPLMALPLGTLFVYTSKRNLLHLFTSVFIGLLLALNLFQTAQYVVSTIDPTRMTREYYFATFGQLYADPEDAELLLADHYNPYFNPEKYSPYFFAAVEDTSRINVLDSVNIYSDKIEFPYYLSSDKDHAWYRVEMDIFIPHESDPGKPLLACRFNANGRRYGSQQIFFNEMDGFSVDQWYHVSTMYLSPDIRHQDDIMECFVWNQGEKMQVRGLKIQSLTK